MKENVKVFLIALVLGMAVAFFLSFKFQDDVVLAINPQVTYFYVASYNDSEKAQQKQEEYAHSLIYEDNGIYKIVIGVYQDRGVIALMSSYFSDLGIDFYTDEMKVDSSFLREIENYEYLIKSSEATYYESINTTILNLFDEYISINY